MSILLRLEHRDPDGKLTQEAVSLMTSQPIFRLFTVSPPCVPTHGAYLLMFYRVFIVTKPFYIGYAVSNSITSMS